MHLSTYIWPVLARIAIHTSLNIDLRDTLIDEATKLRSEGYQVYMTGDFNAWLGSSRGGCFAKNHSDINLNGTIVGNMIDILNLPYFFRFSPYTIMFSKKNSWEASEAPSG